MIVTPSPRIPRAARGSGFTLIELLVVVAIIALLAGVTIPIAKMVGEASNNTRSLTNLRSIGTALNTFAADNNNFFPAVESEETFEWTNVEIELEEENLELLPFWVTALIHKSGKDDSDISVNVFNCPGLRWKDEGGDRIDDEEILLAYGATDAMVGFDEDGELNPEVGRSKALIEEAPNTLLVVETKQEGGDPVSFGHVSWDDAKRDLSKGDLEDLSKLDYRFKKVMAALMADGSARSFRFKEKDDLEEPHWTGDDYESIRD